MAKLKGPLFSLSASGKLADTLVFLGWKGLNNVRSYVIPANPKTDPQTLQRDNFTVAVEAIHTAQALAAHPLAETDMTAYSQWGLTEVGPRTWFNQIISSWRKQFVLGLKAAIYRDGTTIASDQAINIRVWFTKQGENSITAGDFWYGKTRTALVSKEAATFPAPDQATAALTGLTNGQKYYIQFRPTAHADFVGAYSGIYTGTPHA